MSIDWTKLAPHRPLPPRAPHYVARADSVAVRLAMWTEADRSPLLIGGATGVGKSTELGRAAELLQTSRVSCLVQLDRHENMRRLTPDRMILRIIQQVGYVAQSVLRIELSESLKIKLTQVDAELTGLAPAPHMYGTSPSTLLNATLSEVSRMSRQRKVALLIDGLEKTPEGESSHDLFEALSAILEEVDLVVVIPWHATFGPRAEALIRAGERFVPVHAIEVEGEHAESGREFLRAVLLRRLELPDESLDPEAVVRTVGGEAVDAPRAAAAAGRRAVDSAASWSAGIPRVFLQLMADAGSYAKIRGRDSWPTDEDMRDAIADQIDSVRRTLLPGDIDAMIAAAGTTGTELPLERKVRLMAHGILIERIREGRPTMELHPLFLAATGRQPGHA